MPAYNAATSSYQYFDRSSPTNSMWNWNYAFLHYCDGYSFISDKPAVQVGNVTVHFRGHAISQAMRQDLLLEKGMAQATDVVVGGCSAGGMAVFLQCDAWADSIRGVNAATKTRCLADSGWFPWAPPDAPNGDGFNEAWIGGYQRMVNDANASEVLPPDCVAQYAANSSFTWACMMAEVRARARACTRALERVRPAASEYAVAPTPPLPSHHGARPSPPRLLVTLSRLRRAA
jgi:hypothetical protein